jgi:hypothetical protein
VGESGAFLMDLVREFLEVVKRQGQAKGNLLGLLHICIGRRIEKADGTLISLGVTWRDLAALLKKLRWPTEVVTELGLDPDKLAPRDRQRFWYAAIAHAKVDSAEAATAGDHLAEALLRIGYRIGAAPGKE